MQEAASPTHYEVASGLPDAEGAAQRATAVIEVPWMSGATQLRAADGTPVRATCGVTFIDRTHAITAAHCVEANDVPDPSAARLPVSFIDVATNASWRSATVVEGTFPEYSHRAIGAGYTKQTITCRVDARCGQGFGPHRCPPGATAADADIALLACDEGLPADREPVALAKADAGRGEVTMFWFHEVYAIPADGDLFDHYMRKTASPETNFHYFGDGRNDLLPLVSKPWSRTVPRQRLGPGPKGSVWTDLFGCHGSSGSGVFQRDRVSGSWELLGPVASGGAWANDRLCADGEALRRGEESVAYTSLAVTREIAALVDDR